MSEFTDDDRNRLIETHTLVREMKDSHGRRLDDHETRLRKNEGIIAKAVTYASIAGVVTASLIQAAIKKLTSGES